MKAVVTKTKHTGNAALSFIIATNRMTANLRRLK